MVARTAPPPPDTIYDDLAKLTPPRKHYQRYYQTREANENSWHPPQGLHAFLRAYYHMKSADWTENRPAPLAARTASEWAKMPRYYIMDLDKGMAEQVATEMPSAAQIAANRWLPDADLRVYTEEYGRTGFQGGLNGYRGSPGNVDLEVFAGRTIDVPSTFMGGKSDWGVYQNPGALDRLEKTATTNTEARTSSTVRATGCSRNSRRSSAGSSSISSSRRHDCRRAYVDVRRTFSARGPFGP